MFSRIRALSHLSASLIYHLSPCGFAALVDDARRPHPERARQRRRGERHSRHGSLMSILLTYFSLPAAAGTAARAEGA